MSISLSSKVQAVVNAIQTEDLLPVVEPGDGKVYVLDITQREFGSLQYTVFDEVTRFPEKSYSVKYGTQHTIHQTLYSAFTRYELDAILTDIIPGQPRSDWDPMIVPVLTKVYPTHVKKDPDEGKQIIK